jgi:xylulokinase
LDKLLLAYDLGTNGVKAALFTPDGLMAVSAYQEYGVLYPAAGWVEQSIDVMWQAQCTATRLLLKQAGCSKDAVAGLAISSQRATFAGLDDSGQPVTNFIGWQDARSAAECAMIEQRIGSDAYCAISGLAISTVAAISKILWIKKNNPDLFSQIAEFATTQCVHLRQLGITDAPTDIADAGYSGLLDVNLLEWSHALLLALGIPAGKMPRLAPSGSMVGEVSAQAAEALGLAAGTPVALAGGDLQCAGVGLGIVKPGLVSVGIGSGGGLLAFSGNPVCRSDMRLSCQPHVAPGKWEIEGICLASGATFKWYRDTLSGAEKAAAEAAGLDAYDTLCQNAANVRPGTSGLLFLPALAGAGAPRWNPETRGALLGLSLSASKAQIDRAILEGICLEIRAMLETAKKFGVAMDEVRIWGGAAKSPVWNQIAADVYGMPVVKTTIADAGLAGAAICAGVGLGLYSSFEEGADVFVKKEAQFDPNPAVQPIYDELYALSQSAFTTLDNANLNTRLAVIQAQAQR